MIGTTITRKDDDSVWEVVGQAGQAWVISPQEFGPAEEISVSVLMEEFDVSADIGQPEAVTEAEAWKVFGEGYDARRQARRRALADPTRRPPTPEEALSAAERDADAAKPTRKRSDDDTPVDHGGKVTHTRRK